MKSLASCSRALYTLDMSPTKKRYYLSALALAVMLLTACASQVPDAIRMAPGNEVSVRTAQHSPKTYIGTQVRWGGDIISVENRPNETWIEVLSRPLDYAGEPNSDATSTGRFLARINGFLDPAVYAPEREITIRGQLESTIVRHIGKHPYRFPLVRVQVHYLWPKPSKTDDLWYDPWYPYPYGYDPFYGPYAPYYWDPYFPRPRHGYRY